MIKDYMKLLCPVIEIEDFNRAILMLPTRDRVNKDTNSDTYTVLLDGDEEKFVMFDWDETANQWRIRNRIVIKVGLIPEYYCDPCKKKTQHIVNMEVTKKKCKICQNVSVF